MADAEVTTVWQHLRPTMRLVAVKTEEQQARGMLFRTRDLLVRQRTQTINALRKAIGSSVAVPAGSAPSGPRLSEKIRGLRGRPRLRLRFGFAAFGTSAPPSPAPRSPSHPREMCSLATRWPSGLPASSAQSTSHADGILKLAYPRRLSAKLGKGPRKRRLARKPAGTAPAAQPP